MKNDLLGSIMSGMKIPQSETSEWEGQPRMTDDKKGVAMVGESTMRSVDSSDNSCSGADKKKAISKKRRLEELISDEELCKKTSGGRGRIENLKKKPADGSDKTISKKRRVEELLSDEELCKKTSGRRGRIENLKKSADSSGNSRYCPLVALKEMVRKRRRKELFDDEE